LYAFSSLVYLGPPQFLFLFVPFQSESEGLGTNWHQFTLGAVVNALSCMGFEIGKSIRFPSPAPETLLMQLALLASHSENPL